MNIVRLRWLFRRKMRWIMITKTTMVVIFDLKNSHLLNLPTEDVFQVNGQNRLVANLPVVDFHSQTREIPKPLNTQLSVFLLVYWVSFFLGKFESHCLPAIRIFQCFSHHNSRKLRQTTCIENRGDFAVHSSTWPSGAKGVWRISSWLDISTHVKKYVIFSRVLLRLFSGPEIHVWHRRLCDKIIYMQLKLKTLSPIMTDLQMKVWSDWGARSAVLIDTPHHILQVLHVFDCVHLLLVQVLHVPLLTFYRIFLIGWTCYFSRCFY